MSDLKIVDGPDPDEDLIRSLRLDPAQTDATVPIPITLKCRKPGKQEFIRVHNTIELNVRGIVMEEDGDFYVVGGRMTEALGDEAKSFCLRPYINRAGTLRLWPIRLPDTDGRVNEWHRSAAVAASLAMKQWLRVTADRDAGSYQVHAALIQPPEPEWPDLSLAEMLRLAFASQGRIIDGPDHPVVKQLLGRL
jgi:hypothetical protein